MARRPYRMTPKRRAALRKAQLVSARKRRKGTSTKTRTSRKRVIKRVAVVGTVGAGAAYGVHRYNNPRLYHNTSHHSARMIKKSGFSGSAKKRAGEGNKYQAADHIYFTNRKRSNAKAYGTDTVRVTMKRKQYKRVVSDGHYQGGSRYREKYSKVHYGNLKGAKVKRVRTVKHAQIRARSFDPYGHLDITGKPPKNLREAVRRRKL